MDTDITAIASNKERDIKLECCNCLHVFLNRVQDVAVMIEISL